ncbi:MAG: DUF4249 domain-containing protein [Bacteroidales bacterium]
MIIFATRIRRQKGSPGIPLYLALLGLGLFFQNCSSDLEFDMPTPDAKIVIDGWIGLNEQAKVFLTTNSPYFSSIDSASLRDLVLTRAKVTLSDGEKEEVLILRRDEQYFPPMYYAGNTIFGKPGKTYTIKAEYGGKTAQAETTIPLPVPLDTCYFELNDNSDSLGVMILKFTDPPDEKNYYRIFARRLGKDNKFISSFIMAINDQYFSGTQVQLSLLRAPASYLAEEDGTYYNISDTVLIRLSSIDKNTFEFWSSYQDEVLNSTNPFASSLNEVKSNITGDGLGIWAGYGSTTDTVFNSQSLRIK